MKSRNPPPDPSPVIQALLSCCRRMCADEVDAAELTSWLGVADPRGPLGNAVSVKPFDRAWRRAEIIAWKDGTTSCVDLHPAKDVRITVGDLEAVFGPGEETTRLHLNAPQKLGFEFIEGGFKCSIYAELVPDGKGAGRRVDVLTVRPDGDV